jgi:hypothetical protein
MLLDSDSLLMMQEFIQPVGTTNDAAVLDQPISTEEIHHKLRAGARHKSPGIDGICFEFHTANWDTIRTDLTELINQIFMHKNIHRRQKHGILVCLPRLNGDHKPECYRPISLLTAGYKILSRILANRLRHFLAGELQHIQYCGVPGPSILDAVSKVRDILAHHETTGTPLCILTLDFHNAFDRISHAYLFHTLRAYGIKPYTLIQQPLYKSTVH